MVKNKKRGVLIIAAGHTMYGCWALNLCLSIKYSDMNIPVTLAYAGGSLGHIERYKSNFDQIIEIPQEMYTKHGVTDYVKAKTHIFDISPYESTIFIDADVILFKDKPISNLFDELDEFEFTIASREKKILSETKELHWAKPEDIIEAYGYDGEVYNISSEFIYFKKTEKVKTMFEMAQAIYEEPQIKFTKFNGSIADELPLMLAMAFNELKPHKEQFLPFYWEHFENKSLPIGEIVKKGHWGYSIGGNMAKGQMKKIYDGLANFYALQFGLRAGFPLRNKRDFLTTRDKI